MKQEEAGCWTKRLSLKQLADKAERQIFQVLQVHSQPSEDASERLHLHLRRFSKPVLPLAASSPRGSQAKKLPPILRYLSQKFVKQAEIRREEEEYLYKGEKKFKIHTHSLRKLQPYSKEASSLPVFVGKEKASRNKIQEALQEMVGRKSQINKMIAAKQEKQKRQMKGGAELLPFGRTFGKNEKISGWHTQEHYEDVL